LKHPVGYQHQHQSVFFSCLLVLSATTRGYQALSGTLSHICYPSVPLCPFSNNQGLPRTLSHIQHYFVSFSYLQVLSGSTSNFPALSAIFSILQLPPVPFSSIQGLPATFWHSQSHSASFGITLCCALLVVTVWLWKFLNKLEGP
jgi:hypothetical protein